MASSSFLLRPLLLLLLLLLLFRLRIAASYAHMNITIVNNCPFTIWPAIQPNSGDCLLQRGGFALPSLYYRSFRAPCNPWSGRIWARTGCSSSASGFSCVTGDCAGRLECAGAGGSTPITLVQLDLHHGQDRELSSYGVSLVDGFNLPLTVTPHDGTGTCPVVGCSVNLLNTCPERLTVASGGAIVGCRSGCAAFATDELCCRNAYAEPGRCRPSTFSEFFKNACPTTYTYAQDSPSMGQRCADPKELKVVFCPP